MNQDVNRNENIQSQEHQQSSSQWSQMIGQVMEKLTDKNMSTTIRFEDFEVDIPRAQGPGGRDLGSAKWTVNGKNSMDNRGT
jgi:protein subunit release factor B